MTKSYNIDHNPARHTFECEVCERFVHFDNYSEMPEGWFQYSHDEMNDVTPNFPVFCSESCERDWIDVYDSVIRTAKELFKARMIVRGYQVKAKIARGL